MSNDEKYYVIDIQTEDSPKPSLLDEIRSLNPTKKSKKSTEDDYEPVVISSIPKKEKKEKKKKKKSILLFDDLDIGKGENDDESKSPQEIDEETLLDIDNIMRQRDSEEEDIEDDLTTKGKKGYKDLKKNKDKYKKEFAEELTLLYSLLDDTSKFGKKLEKDLSQLQGSKVRGVSKYTNELAQLVLSAKQSKLNIVKEIHSIKKTAADLTIKAEAKSKDDGNKNNPEYLASAYFKNILSHGRSNFIDNITSTNAFEDDDEDEYATFIDKLEKVENNSEEDIYSKLLADRLEHGNPYRSEAGTKYIEYENRGVKLYVKKCIDTGEWEFVAIDKNRQQVDDYPVPTKREAGRMKFSDDGSYATDSKGRIYNVIEYFLPEH